LKKYLKNYKKRFISALRIKLHSVKLDPTDRSMIFNLRIIGFLGNKYLLIKHRKTGKRILKPVKNSQVELYNNELDNMGEMGIFDIYLKRKFGRFEFIERTRYESVNYNKTTLNMGKKTILRPFKTVESNLSFILKEALFNHEITFLESNNNYLLIEGVLELFEDIPFGNVELAAKSNEIAENKIFNCEYKKEQSKVYFKVKINLDIINQHMNLYIRLKNKNIIISQEAIKIDNFKKFY